MVGRKRAVAYGLIAVGLVLAGYYVVRPKGETPVVEPKPAGLAQRELLPPAGPASPATGGTSGSDPMDDDLSSKETVASAAEQTSGQQQFNLFAPPKIEMPVVRERQSGEEKESVRLVGFVNVDKLKVLLAFESGLRAMEVGDVYRKVEVVQIDPPRVTLQKGQERWITTLFDQPVIHTTHQEAGPRASPQVTIGSSAGRSPFAPMASGGVASPPGGNTSSPANHSEPEIFGGLAAPPGIDDLPMPELPELPPLPGQEPKKTK
ncbi:MAG: hypothetical protein KatS3mg110_0771 [Pirellulaceae bacterium]|nr:MAG: hypothetical protein KatS3mg110_0771 [Pirellulaceae bacterium]